uniref:C-type lectin domain-containing protein n=1 Tax=Sphenodon punctatus TaxID=8508 RepID=A0A8D0GPG8_SPHPU
DNIRVWIGLSAFDPNTGFTWSDGSPVNYENWADEQPDNANENEKCGELTTSGKWNDMNCGILCNFICQLKRGTDLNPEPHDT